MLLGVVASACRGRIDPQYGDPHWDNVVALLHFEGNFNDSSGKSGCTPMSGAGISTEVFKFGSGSFSLDGSGQYAVLSGPELALGTGDFTIEMFARKDGWSDHSLGEVFLIDTRGGGSSQMLIDINNSAQRRLRYYFDSKERIAAVDAIDSDFSHVAVSREGGVSRMFVDGVFVGQVSDTFNITSTTWHIGGRFELFQGSRLSWNGNIDELRITKGVARYTENFTPPTAPFPNFGPPIIEPAPEIYSATFTMVPGDNNGAGPLGFEDSGGDRGSISPASVDMGAVNVVPYLITWNTTTGRLIVELDNLASFDAVAFLINDVEYVFEWETTAYGVRGVAYDVFPAPFVVDTPCTIELTVTSPVV